jgi:hypothetical protein
MYFNKAKDLREFLLDSGDIVDQIQTGEHTFYCTVLGVTGNDWNVKLIDGKSGSIWEFSEFFHVFAFDNFTISLI